ncbi:MAG: fibronectin type III domain-containing protein [Gammaproteobacteria bacterium]|nr:fibronectin type III domain-containing protein [Gammaproteobacteria bacterium]
MGRFGGVGRQIQNLSATGGDLAGECDLNSQPVKNVRNYVVEMSPDPVTPTRWAQVGLPTKSRFTASGLTSGVKYWFRVAASGSQGPGAWSDPATARAS